MTARLAMLFAVLTALLTGACSTGGSPAARTVTVTPHGTTPGATSPGTTAVSSASPSAPASEPTPTPTKPPKVVRVTAMQSDGGTYGVGLPIVLFFNPAPTDSSAFTKAVRVTVNGQPANGAWFWEQPTADEVNAGTVEAHYRTPSYWPAGAKVHVSVPIGGLSAGKNLIYSDRLTSLDFAIGDAHVSTVNARTLKMYVRSNGRLVKTIPVSLGDAKTPTFNGVKVVMQKGEQAPGSNALRPDGTVRMVGRGYDELVKWSVRITRSGEYVHAAPWNSQIGQASTSNGCTNLATDNANWFYHFADIGDVVRYVNTDGDLMPSWDGFGDWNVPWAQWAQGGLLLNH